MYLMCKQDIHAEAVKKRRRTTKKPYSRSIVGATLEVIQKKRSEKPEVRDAAREAALRYFFFCLSAELFCLQLVNLILLLFIILQKSLFTKAVLLTAIVLFSMVLNGI